MSDSHHLLRLAPPPRLEAIPADEAVDLAKASFYEARRAQCEMLAASINRMLFDTSKVDYRRLKSLRSAARRQVESAQRVEQLLNDAIDAFEATR